MACVCQLYIFVGVTINQSGCACWFICTRVCKCDFWCWQKRGMFWGVYSYTNIFHTYTFVINK